MTTRDDIRAEITEIARQEKALAYRRRELQNALHQLDADEHKANIKALGHRRRVWLRHNNWQGHPYGSPFTTVRFGPKRVTVKDRKGVEWALPYGWLTATEPSAELIADNLRLAGVMRSMGHVLGAVR